MRCGRPAWPVRRPGCPAEPAKNPTRPPSLQASHPTMCPAPLLVCHTTLHEAGQHGGSGNRVWSGQMCTRGAGDSGPEWGERAEMSREGMNHAGSSHTGCRVLHGARARWGRGDKKPGGNCIVPGMGLNSPWEQRDQDRLQCGQTGKCGTWRNVTKQMPEKIEQKLAKASYLVFAALTALQAGQDLALNGLHPELPLL